MSFFAGRDREGKAIVHSTTDSRDIYTLQGSPIPSTMFHSSLPYIFANTIEVQPTQYTISMFKWWENYADLECIRGLNGWTQWYDYPIPIRRSVMLVILPEAMKYAIANNKVYMITVTNKVTGRSYLIQDSLDYLCGGMAMLETLGGGYAPVSTEVGDYGGVRIHWANKIQGEDAAIAQPVAHYIVSTNPPTEVIPQFTGGNPRKVAQTADNSYTLAPAEDQGGALKAGVTEGILLIDEGRGDNNASNWKVNFHILSISVKNNAFINEAANTTGQSISISGAHLKVGNSNILDKSILRVGSGFANSYPLNSYKYGSLISSALTPFERSGPGERNTPEMLAKLYTRFNRHSTRADDASFIGVEATTSTGMSKFSLWKGGCTNLILESGSISMIKDGVVAPFFNPQATPLYKIGASKYASLQPPTKAKTYVVPANTVRCEWKSRVSGPIMDIGESFEHIIYYTKMRNDQVAMIYNKPWSGIMSYEAMNVRNPSLVERGRAYGLTSLTNIGEKKLISTVTMHDLGYVAIGWSMGVIVKYAFFLEKISSTQIQLNCDVLAIGHNYYEKMAYTSDSNQSLCLPIDVVLAKIY